MNGESEETRFLNQELRSIAFPNQQTSQYMSALEMNLGEDCGKWNVLKGLLEEWHEENEAIKELGSTNDPRNTTSLNKVLIFTKSKKLLDCIDHALQYRGTLLFGYLRCPLIHITVQDGIVVIIQAT